MNISKIIFSFNNIFFLPVMVSERFWFDNILKQFQCFNNREFNITYMDLGYKYGGHLDVLKKE